MRGAGPVGVLGPLPATGVPVPWPAAGMDAKDNNAITAPLAAIELPKLVLTLDSPLLLLLRATPTAGTSILRRPGKQLFPVRQHHRPGITGVGRILGSESLDGDFAPDLQGILAPALPGQRVRGPTLALPFSHSARLIFGVEVNPDVRIQPLEFCD